MFQSSPLFTVHCSWFTFPSLLFDHPPSFFLLRDSSLLASHSPPFTRHSSLFSSHRLVVTLHPPHPTLLCIVHAPSTLVSLPRLSPPCALNISLSACYTLYYPPSTYSVPHFPLLFHFLSPTIHAPLRPSFFNRHPSFFTSFTLCTRHSSLVIRCSSLVILQSPSTLSWLHPPHFPLCHCSRFPGNDQIQNILQREENDRIIILYYPAKFRAPGPTRKPFELLPLTHTPGTVRSYDSPLVQ